VHPPPYVGAHATEADAGLAVPSCLKCPSSVTPFCIAKQSWSYRRWAMSAPPDAGAFASLGEGSCAGSGSAASAASEKPRNPLL